MSHKNVMILIYEEIKTIIFSGKENASSKKGLNIYYNVYIEVVWASFACPWIMDEALWSQRWWKYFLCFIFICLAVFFVVLKNIQSSELYFLFYFAINEYLLKTYLISMKWDYRNKSSKTVKALLKMHVLYLKSCNVLYCWLFRFHNIG